MSKVEVNDSNSYVPPLAEIPALEKRSTKVYRKVSRPHLLRHMNMVSMRIQEPIADELPWSFAPRPRAEQLNRITIRLRPSSVILQRLVETPSQVVPFLFHQFVARPSPPYHRLNSPIPSCLPHIQPSAAHRIDIGGSANLMMPDGARLEYDVDRMCFRRSRLSGKSLKHLFKLIRQPCRHEPIHRKMFHTIGVARSNGDPWRS